MPSHSTLTIIAYLGMAVIFTLPQTLCLLQFIVIITTLDPRIIRCSILNSLQVETFSTSLIYDFSQGCEYQLVQSCSNDLQLSVNVDFIQGEFASGRLLIRYNDSSLYVYENFTVSSVGNEIGYLLLDDCGAINVSITSIGFMLVRAESSISITFTETVHGFPFVTGICGSSSDSILYSNCVSEVDVNDINNITTFIDDFKVPAFDLMLHEQRGECGKYYCIGAFV